MSAAAPIEAGGRTSEVGARPGAATATVDWRVRAAGPGDVAGVTAAVAELLVELGGTPPRASAMQTAALGLIEDSDAGAVLLAEADSELVGVLAASWQTAIHIPGRYALIQDLWVRPSWRRGAIGAALLQALFEHARRSGIERVEVGLPREGFANLRATDAFYRRNGFTSLGARMRTVLAQQHPSAQQHPRQPRDAQ
jgi:GNAT superfamily N-acetyltransferase